MRRTIVTATLVVALLGARPAGATQGEEAGRAVAAAALNAFYVPVKAVMAVVGLATGSLVGLASGGDVRAAYAIWVPTASGTWFFTPAEVEGSREVEFFGSDYADRPSGLGIGEPGRASYDAMYGM
jgi:hypothetical protein